MYDPVPCTTMEVSVSSSNGGKLGTSNEKRSVAVSSNVRDIPYVDKVGLWNVLPIIQEHNIDDELDSRQKP